MIALAILAGVWVIGIILDSIDGKLERIAKAYEEDLSIYRKRVDPTEKRK